MIGGMILGNQEQTRCWGAAHALAWLCVHAVAPAVPARQIRAPARTRGDQLVPGHVTAGECLRCGGGGARVPVRGALAHGRQQCVLEARPARGEEQ